MSEGISRVLQSHVSLGTILFYSGCMGIPVFIYISLLQPINNIKFARPKYGVETMNNSLASGELDVKISTNYLSGNDTEIDNITDNP